MSNNWQTSLIPRLPASSPTLFEAKKKKNLSFETIAKHIGRDEVAVAALFYGQAKASEEDVKKLSELLEVDHATLQSQLYAWPDRGQTMDMPPKEPLIYRLYEIVQNYGYAYKAVLNEKFGDGIMSAITFSTSVRKETDEKGDWAVITLRGKWYVFITHMLIELLRFLQGYHTPASEVCTSRTHRSSSFCTIFHVDNSPFNLLIVKSSW